MRAIIATLALGTLAAGLVAAGSAKAEMELSVYSGVQGAPSSDVSGDYPGTGADYSVNMDWDGKSFDMPPYYGVRATWWRDNQLGFGMEFTHTKVYGDGDDRAAIGFEDFEFTDGLNIVTANALKRWPGQWGPVTPYVGGGLGVAVPHVDVDTVTGSETYELQLSGPAARVMAGASYEITDRLSVFGEYQVTYSSNDVDLDDGGSAQTDITTNALNVGLSLKF